jgi:hypothetical protein
VGEVFRQLSSITFCFFNKYVFTNHSQFLIRRMAIAPHFALPNLLFAHRNRHAPPDPNPENSAPPVPEFVGISACDPGKIAAKMAEILDGRAAMRGWRLTDLMREMLPPGDILRTPGRFAAENDVRYYFFRRGL